MTKKLIEEVAARYTELGIKPCAALREWCKRPTDILVLHRLPGEHFVTCFSRKDGKTPLPIYETLGITE